MKKFIFCSVILLFFLCSCSRAPQDTKVILKIVSVYPNEMSEEIVFYNEGEEIARQIFDPQGNLIYQTGVIPDGIVKQYYPDTQIHKEIPYLNGKINGTLKEYFPNGNIAKEISYKDNLIWGEVKLYFEDGGLWDRLIYKKEIPHGWELTYNKDGKLIERILWREGQPIRIYKKG